MSQNVTVIYYSDLENFFQLTEYSCSYGYITMYEPLPVTLYSSNLSPDSFDDKVGYLPHYIMSFTLASYLEGIFNMLMSSCRRWSGIEKSAKARWMTPEKYFHP
jgi:hypothetical protein